MKTRFYDSVAREHLELEVEKKECFEIKSSFEEDKKLFVLFSSKHNGRVLKKVVSSKYFEEVKI